MPELPEVETTKRGILPYLKQHQIQRIVVREKKLRWPIPDSLQRIRNLKVNDITRRAKYLLIHTEQGLIILHLGMSGSLRILTEPQPAGKHDHVDFHLDSDAILRFNDPRKFGAVLWHTGSEPHSLLAKLGPEPLDRSFAGRHLWHASRGRRGAVKNFIMDSRIVVGVGNIYASEALFESGIHPNRAAGRISAKRYDLLAQSIKQVLRRAIKKGGTTLKDFVNPSGETGYFSIELAVYDRAGDPCTYCTTPIKSRIIGQRSSYYCPNCQH